jgi:hypothetical protein
MVHLLLRAHFRLLRLCLRLLPRHRQFQLMFSKMKPPLWVHPLLEAPPGSTCSARCAPFLTLGSHITGTVVSPVQRCYFGRRAALYPVCQRASQITHLLALPCVCVCVYVLPTNTGTSK